MLKKYFLETSFRNEILNIDYELKEAIENSNISDGIAIIYCPHTTAGITINENGDPDVLSDMIFGLEKISPKRDRYRHFEGNSDSHIKSSIIGASEYIIVSDGKPLLGVWQSLYFCEFDGPRRRKFYIKIVEG